MLFCVVWLNLYGHCNISKTLYTEWNTNSCFANTNTKRMWAREHILNWPNATTPCILFLILLLFIFFVDLNDWKLITCIKVVNRQIDERHKQLDIILLLVLRHYTIVDFLHFLCARPDSMCTKYQHHASYNKERSPSNGKRSDFSFYIDSQKSAHRKCKK